MAPINLNGSDSKQNFYSLVNVIAFVWNLLLGIAKCLIEKKLKCVKEYKLKWQWYLKLIKNGAPRQ